MKLDNAIDAALVAAGAKNGKAVKALIDGCSCDIYSTYHFRGCASGKRGEFLMYENITYDLANKLLANGVTDIKQEFPKETVTFHGEDITGQVEEAWNFLVKHAFVM